MVAERVRSRLTAFAAASIVLVLSACGGGDQGDLERADEALGELRRAELSVGYLASAQSSEGEVTGPVGFSVQGSFDLDAGTSLPVLDVVYTRKLGSEEHVVDVKSDGNRMVVTTDGESLEVPPERAGSLRLGRGDRPAGLEGLGVSGWITEPAEGEGPTVDGVSTRKVSGPVDAADLVSDIAALLAEVAGTEKAPPLEGEAAERVRSLVRSGDVEVLLDDDDVPRRVRATADFGAATAPELQAALGPYAGATLELTLEVRAPGRPVTPPSLPPVG